MIKTHNRGKKYLPRYIKYEISGDRIMIKFNEHRGIFHLFNDKISYILQIEETRYLAHLYFGKRIEEYTDGYTYPKQERPFSPNPADSVDSKFSLDNLLMEYPGFGFGDFREPAHNIKLADGSRINDFRYLSHEIFNGKKRLDGLPATYVTDDTQAMTLEITLEDRVSNLQLILSYTIFSEMSVICRSTRFVNLSSKKVEVNRMASASIDFSAKEMDLIHLPGAWARERQVVRENISNGTKRLESKRGTSSHHQNPVAILIDKNTTEFVGDAYGFTLIYSGNFEIVIEKDTFDQTRILTGINSFNFAWNVEPSESFQTPEAVMVYSPDGLNDLSQTYHRLFNNHLSRGHFQNAERPILINNWEATYFDFDSDKIMLIVEQAKKLGIELFVLDDGWFGKRDDDTSSLGDWFEYEGKLKDGLKTFSEQVHQKGMKFGLWFEPEMISENSKLYEAHPDWAMGVPGRARTLGRNQYVLDYSRKEVWEHIYEQMKVILDNVEIDYIKWDMNRNLTDVYSLALTPDKQGEVAHRYVLGLYEFMEKITNAYPHILFESCSGGGGRFDAGMLYYMPQAWASDNTDAVARLNIQYGTSLIYPISSMGAHVSEVPNHQTGRITSLSTRGNVAMSGVFGYELDLSKLSEDELAEMKEQVAFYKEHRELIQYGTFIRLISPYENNGAAWTFVSKDKSQALIFYYELLAQANAPFTTLKLKGLDADAVYEVSHVDSTIITLEQGLNLGGDQLMNLGFYINPNGKGDFASGRILLKKCPSNK